MRVVYSEKHERHQPRVFVYRGQIVDTPENAVRATMIAAALGGAGHEIVAPADFGLAPIRAVHAADYLEFLETIHARWAALPGAGPEVVANVHPNRNMGRRPEGVVGLVGWHTADTACPIVEGTWEAALASAHAAIHAAELVLEGANAAYALCRPPGHHAYADMAGGFCYLNNTAIAAQHLRRRFDRVAILDIDVHHGNGTQGIFWTRGDVLTVSVHADPAGFYPWYAGYPDERGAGDGLGFNLNLPLAQGSDDSAFLDAVMRGLGAMRDFAPAALVVAAGFDTHERDPLGAFKVTTPAYRELGRRIAALEIPTVIVQEGGYGTAELPENVLAFLAGFETR
ncbi:MAG: histone deacetylase family protein [Rhodospirillales bacterium]|nr:histone deacetylase family protein [Rhodospirillales bacterium]